MKQAIIDTLGDADEPLGWEELVDATGATDEDELDEAIEALQYEDVVRYKGRRPSGYVLAGEAAHDDADV